MGGLVVVLVLVAAAAVTVVQGQQRPLLLVPGVAGSVLRSENADSGAVEDVWLRATYADSVLREHLLGWYERSGDTVRSFFPGWSIVPERGDSGLDGVDSLYRSRLIRIAAVDYFHDMIVFLRDTLGYRPGKTLFAMPYDWRLPSNSSSLQRELDSLLQRASDLNEGSQVDIIAHSFGGFVVRSFVATFCARAEKLIHSFITIGTPWQGASGLPMLSFVSGYNLGNPLVTPEAQRLLSAGIASSYQLLPNPHFTWPKTGKPSVTYRLPDEGDAPPDCKVSRLGSKRYCSVRSSQLGSLLSGVLAQQSWTHPKTQKTHRLPFRMDMHQMAQEIRQSWSQSPFPSTIRYFSVYGTGQLTPHTVTFEERAVGKGGEAELLGQEHVFSFVDGDGTVPTDSALADDLPASERVSVEADHVVLLRHDHTLNTVREWLGQPCRLDGQWHSSWGIVTVQQQGHDITVSASDEDFLLEGQGKLLHGRVSGELTGQAEGTFSLTLMDGSCTTGKLEWQHPFATSAGPFSLSLTLQPSSRCAGERRACAVPHGRGHTFCPGDQSATHCLIDSCDPGHSLQTHPSDLRSSGGCVPCPPGTFKVSPGLHRCTPCPRGDQEHPSSPATTVRTLRAGAVSEREGCARVCAPGHELRGGGARCVPCSPGFYKETAGPGPCRRCGSTGPAMSAFFTGVGGTSRHCPSLSLSDVLASPGSGHWTVLLLGVCVGVLATLCGWRMFLWWRHRLAAGKGASSLRFGLLSPAKEPKRGV